MKFGGGGGRERCAPADSHPAQVVGQVILQPLSSTVPATSTPLTTLVTLKRSSGAEPLGLGVADKERGDELVLAGAIEGRVRPEGDFGRQVEVLQRLRHVDCLQRLGLGGGERAGPGGDIAEPVARRRNPAGALLDRLDEFRDMRHARLVPVPFHDPGADARLGRQAFERLQLLLRAGEMDLLVEAELNRLLEGVQHVVALDQEEDDVRVRRLRLDEIGRKVDAARAEPDRRRPSRRRARRRL